MSFSITPIKINLNRLKGPQGPIGGTGINGINGPDGQVGATGAPGQTGPVGDGGPSIVGPQGVTGNSGSPGVNGSSGATGPQGNIGPVGSDVAIMGMTGPQGDAGNQGSQGPQGFIGNSGGAGAGAGMTGPPGPQGEIVPFPVPTGLIYNDATGGLLETDQTPVFNLVQGRIGPSVCSAGNITLWNAASNLSQVNVTNGEIGPAQFQITVDGTYLVGYNIDLNDADDDTSFFTDLFIECQVGGFAQLGSRSSITVDTINKHISQKFLTGLFNGDTIGLYASNSLQNDLCINFNKASFWLYRVGPLVIT